MATAPSRCGRPLLVWIFAEFDGFAHRPLTQNDVFYNNNRNAFLMTEETVAASLAAGRLQLECRWEEPLYPAGTTPLQRRIVPFQDLTLDWEKQQAYYFDFYGPQERIRAELARRGGDPDKLSEQFRRLWRDGYFDIKDTPEFRQLLANLRRAGVWVPPRLDYHLLNALYTARMGTPVGYKSANSLRGRERENLLLIAHHVHDKHPTHFLTFCKALAVYGKLEQLRAEDKSGKWGAKYEAAKQKFREGDTAFQRDISHDPLVAFLFPEIFASTEISSNGAKSK
ncbi:hypothetical protein [Noviherbaspirillum pedocola]|uniref:Uncharacterized protein n=1 Tax=Noviherbaspirillum pedocola TaxID=2801341 RepID=A0A934SW07_9BURK|nr:hypothetical protein [Noviherbaspirillum pedocola]MBK4736792.1 hypothetical protein [Noviherbaspirillum pedocola]